jgi:uncharacterized protein
MPVNVAFRSLAAGTAAAVIVVGAYAFGHTASAAPAARGDVATPGASPAAPSGTGISVTGTGRVTGKPNLLRLQTSIDVTKSDVNSAMQEANTTMASVQKTLKADGVADADLQTSGLSVQPNYDYSGGTAHLNGYRVSENLSVVLRNLDRAGSIISDAARVGGDELRIGGATLDLDEDGALIAQARQKAFADAKAKAAAYADAAGRSLGAVLSISESTDSRPQPYYFDAAPAAAASNAPVPIQAGSQDVTVTISAVWAMG